jgi:FdhE protein
MSETKLYYRKSLDEETKHFDPILKPALHELYTARAARLRLLSEEHELKSYLQLAADISQAQSSLLDLESTSTDMSSLTLANGCLDVIAIARKSDWCHYLEALLSQIDSSAPEATRPHLETLKTMPHEDRIEAGVLLAQGSFNQIHAALAPFIWAALSSAIAVAARKVEAPLATGHEHHNCPVCDGTPVASLIHTGERQGSRYLHCSLCESEWHMVRAKCTNCDNSENLDYLSFESTDAAVRAESCGDCHSYLKVISHVQDPSLEVVADDLATLRLDAAVTAEGYGRTGLNPFALPTAES